MSRFDAASQNTCLYRCCFFLRELRKRQGFVIRLYYKPFLSPNSAEEERAFFMETGNVRVKNQVRG